MSELGTVLYYVGMAGKHLSREDIVIAVRHTLEDKGNEVMQNIAEQWIAEGFDKGIKQGVKQGIEQGRVQMLQEDILDLLYARFGLASEELAARITAVTDITTLRQMLRQAGTLETADAFVKLLADLP